MLTIPRPVVLRLNITRCPSKSFATAAQSQELTSDYRVNIRSPSLCDDVLQRLAPSLPKSGPLDIIDLYPGTSLWSSKFHDLIKPRRHVLVEPNSKTYEAYLEPLLNQSGSRYTHVPWDPERTDILSNLVLKGYLPEQGQHPLEPSEPVQRNDTLLLLANLTNARNRTKIRHRVLLNYVAWALDRKGLHQYGLVRMIALVPTSKMEIMLPKHLGRRRKPQMTLEAIASDIIEVAGDTLDTEYMIRRGMLVVDESSARASRQSDRTGIVIPTSRRAKAVDVAPDPEKAVFTDRKYPRRPRHPWHENYLELLKESRQAVKQAEKAGTPLPGNNTPVNRRLIQLRKLYNLESKQIGLCYEADNKQAEIDKLNDGLRNILSQNLPVPNETEAREIISSIRRLKNERDIITAPLNKQYIQFHYPQHQDERRAYFQNEEPLLPWDRRPYEPLHVTADEFSPQTACSIVDIRPDPSAPVFRSQHGQGESGFAYQSTLEFFRSLLRLCTPYRKKPIGQVLRLIFPDRPIPELLAPIPSLVPLATPSISLNPADTITWSCVKKNQNVVVGYDDTCLDDATMQRASPTVVWETAVEWEKWLKKTGSVDNFAHLLRNKMIDD